MVYMSSLALSVLLSLVSAVAYAAGAIVQERVAAAGDGRSLAPLRNRVWWAAVALNGAGAVLHVVALAYGPLSLVQPLGALTIVFALPMAALFVRRRARATAWRGAIMATVGLAGLLALTGNGESRSLSGPDQLMLSGVTLGGVAALFLASKGVHRPVVRSVIVAGAAGVAFGIASVFTKTVAVRWTSGDAGAGICGAAGDRRVRGRRAAPVPDRVPGCRADRAAGHGDRGEPGDSRGRRHHHVRRGVPARYGGHRARAGVRGGRRGRADPAHDGAAGCGAPRRTECGKRTPGRCGGRDGRGGRGGPGREAGRRRRRGAAWPVCPGRSGRGRLSLLASPPPPYRRR